MITIGAGGNLIALLHIYVSIHERLTRIENDLKWIKPNCEICPQNSVNHTK